jgi:ribosomal protein S18 acetylase RimI-like enzyme
VSARTIRRMEAAELEATVAVWRRSRWHAQPWLEERMGHTPEEDLRHFRDAVARDYEVWVAVEGERIAGLLAVGRGQVDQLYVDPDAQGRGVGAALLAKAKEILPGGLSLYTHQRNERARAFYERHGLRAVRFGVSPPPESEPDVEYAWRPDPVEPGG